MNAFTAMGVVAIAAIALVGLVALGLTAAGVAGAVRLAKQTRNARSGGRIVVLVVSAIFPVAFPSLIFCEWVAYDAALDARGISDNQLTVLCVELIENPNEVGVVGWGEERPSVTATAVGLGRSGDVVYGEVTTSSTLGNFFLRESCRDAFGALLAIGLLFGWRMAVARSANVPRSRLSKRWYA